MNAHAKVTVISDVPVEFDAHAIVAVAFACARVPLGAHAESVSMRTIRLSTGAHHLLSPIKRDDALTHFHIIRIETRVFAATSPMLCPADGTVVT